MAEARQRHDWQIASSVLALLANCHRDPKKSRAFRPGDFDPFTQERGDVIPADIGVLKDVFIKDGNRKEEQGGGRD
ncbi:MAG: hypothetical protein JJU33_09305 [Phycisphaerales bacterium]|nr:hypothetical protein [Phycisphaerales bacterium]